MAKARTLVGLDVHAAKIVAAVLDGETGELQYGPAAPNPRIRMKTSRPGR